MNLFQRRKDENLSQRKGRKGRKGAKDAKRQTSFNAENTETQRTQRKAFDRILSVPSVSNAVAAY